MCWKVTMEYISMKWEGSVTDCSLTGFPGSPPLSERPLALSCPDMAVGRGSRWQYFQLRLVQIRMAAVILRIPKALLISPAVQSKIVHSSSDRNGRWFSFHFCLKGVVIFSNFSEKLPPGGVWSIFRFKPSTISWAISSLSFHGVASAVSPKTHLHNFGCVISFTALLSSNEQWAHLGQSTNHSDAQICQSTGAVPGNWCNPWPMSDDRQNYSYLTEYSHYSARPPDRSENPEKEPLVAIGGLPLLFGITQWHLLPLPGKDSTNW